jgi:hypothetical protein
VKLVAEAGVAGDAYSPVTKLSGEQVTIAQLQGSTEFISQPLNTPWGSLRRSLNAIRACTVGRSISQNLALAIDQCKKQKQDNQRLITEHDEVLDFI